MSNELRSLLARVEESDPDTAKELHRHIDALQSRRQFGLNFERHIPESVALTGRPISVGDKVRFLPSRGETQAESDATWIVTEITGPRKKQIASLFNAKTKNETSRELEELVFVAEFRDPIYPGLKPTGDPLLRDGDEPCHTVINAENYHALEALEFTHQGKIDCIYIDPPYNTGTSDWIYNDKHVDPKDSYLHSKWLAFMERRLKLATRLLKPTGIMIVAIGDEEHHRLRLLLDQILGEANFVSDVVWQGGRKNDSRFISNGADYMLIYAKDITRYAVEGVKPKDAPSVGDLDAEDIEQHGARWWERKPGARETLAKADEIWNSSNDHASAQKAFRSWMREFKKTGVPTDAVTRFTTLDPDTGEPIRTDGNISWPGGGGPRYDVLHPMTGEPCAVPSGGWRYSDPADMQAEIEAGNIYFGPDETTQPGGISRLSWLEEQVPESVFESDRNSGSNYLYFKRTDTGVFPDKRFPNPKDYRILRRWLRIAAPRNAVILDFFGGSGSTLEAVFRSNAEDSGDRQCILITNNEVDSKDDKKLRKEGFAPGDPEYEAYGVFEYVTRPRIETILTGTRVDGTPYAGATVTGSVEFFTLTYENPALVELDLAFERIAPLLWMRAGSEGRRIDERSDTFDIADTYAVLFNIDASKPFLATVEKEDGLRIAYIVTDDESQYQAVAGQLPDGIESVRLYESYLRTFQINTGRV